jgi:tetratricopeptide (TPR) repeat protein
MSDVTDYLRTVARAKRCSQRANWHTAAALWDQVVRQNPVNGNHWEQLGQALFHTGDFTGAVDAYDRAERLGIWADRDTIWPGALEYEKARCLMRLNEPERALDALAAALRQHYRERDRIPDDPDFAALKDNPRFAEIVGPTSADGLDRDEGWRTDVQLLGREAHRRAPFPPPPEFDNAVETLVAAIPGLSDAGILVELHKLVALLGDGHASVTLPDDRTDLNKFLPVQFYLFDEGLFVTSAAPEHAALLGAHITAIDGHSVDDALAALDPLVCRDNEWGPKARLAWMLRRVPLLNALGLTNASDELTLTAADRAETTLKAEARRDWASDELTARPGWLFLPDTVDGELPLYLRNCGACYWYEYLPERRTVYFQFNAVANDPDESFEDFLQRLFDFVDNADVDRLVIDMRWNGGGNTFLVQPLIHGLIRRPRINRAGGLFVIIGRGTFSAAQNTSTFLEEHTHATFVGEPTGSGPVFVGETIPFTLPYSKIRANISDLYWQTGWPMDQRSWIPPAIYAPPTFAAFRANRDDALAAVLSCQEHLPGV